MDPDEFWLFVQVNGDEPIWLMGFEYASDACETASSMAEITPRKGPGRFYIERKGTILFEFPFA